MTGATYDVTVSSEPSVPAQTCEVTNGAGTIAGSNVTNVAVVCTTNTYPIGGTVSGLAPNQSVVLRNNGGNNLTVTANGAGVAAAFTFGAPVASGSSYAVTVFTQPGSPIAQTCTVTSGSGVVGNNGPSDTSTGNDSIVAGNAAEPIRRPSSGRSTAPRGIVLLRRAPRLRTRRELRARRNTGTEERAGVPRAGRCGT